MSTTLSYGYKQPENGDKGSTWFPDLNANITRLNGHSHNGTDSAFIPSSSIVKGTVTIAAGSWTGNGTGSYKQDVTCPAGFNMDDFNIQFRLSGSHVIYPSFERLTSTTFRIYSLDNTLVYIGIFR